VSVRPKTVSTTPSPFAGGERTRDQCRQRAARLAKRRNT
jgi:hypothetical protein